MDCVVGVGSSLTRVVIDDIPGDKSISHRAIILGSLSDSRSIFTHFLTAEDCLNTLTIFQQLGVPIQRDGATVMITGVGLNGLNAPANILDTGNSGTGIRLITGVLAGQSFSSRITGDASIQRRPMKRIISPLKDMGARISGKTIEGKSDIYPQLDIEGGVLHGIRYRLPVASAQVKSAVLLAGLFANSPTVVEEPELCRDHTERLMQGFGGHLTRHGDEIHLIPGRLANPTPDTPIRVPSDFSSSAFFLVLGALRVPITMTGIGMNPTRNTLMDVLIRMGAAVTVTDAAGDAFEPHATLTVSPSSMHNVDVNGAEIPFLIDEIPILAVAALFSHGTLKVRDAAELRVKESDRIAAIAMVVRAMGGQIVEYEDGFDVSGPVAIQSFDIDSHGDHRIAMSAIIGAVASGVSATIRNCECIRTSFPNFFDILNRIVDPPVFLVSDPVT
jgi:3-phosphoshikimate 1-carboxyvinyltransferase